MRCHAIRRTIGFVMLALIWLGGPADGKEPATQTGRPAIEVSEQSFDFGYVPQQSKISHIYWIKNTGDDLLQIQDVKPGCGCTKAPLAKHELSAGDSTYVELVFSTGHYSRSTSKSARIICNSVTNPPRLTFRAHPLPNLDSMQVFAVEPPMLDLDAQQSENGDRDLSFDLKLRNTSDQPLAFALVSAPAMEGITVDLPMGQISPGGEESMRITIDSETASELFTKSLTIEADDDARTRFTLPISKTKRWGPASTSSL